MGSTQFDNCRRNTFRAHPHPVEQPLQLLRSSIRMIEITQEEINGFCLICYGRIVQTSVKPLKFTFRLDSFNGHFIRDLRTILRESQALTRKIFIPERKMF